jgi:predicted metalloprotease with PDZ domain
MKETMKTKTRIALAAAVLALAAPAISATLSAPVAVPLSRQIPDAADVPYPGGTMKLHIDATDITRGAYRVTQTVPVAPGTKRLTLMLPQWLPGNHGPRGPMAELVDIHFFAGDQKLSWKRDPVEVYAFHIDVPAGAKDVTAKYIHTSPLQSAEGRITMTQEMLNLQWEKMSLYPAGHYVRQIKVVPSVTIPQGWTAAVALDGLKQNGNTLTWDATTYEILVDSPIFAGKYFRKWDLGQNVTLNVVADKPEQLNAKPEHIEPHRHLVTESRIAFGANHFDRYEFLLALTDRMGGIGLEHHRSSENQLEPGAFLEWDKYEWDRNLLPHEYAHSWIGKYRRPARLWTPDYRQPMQDDLLWTYEGQDQFWGTVLAARSGLQGKDMVLGMLANWAGGFSVQPGRRWRSVEDTGHDAIFAARKAKPFPSLSRNEDYYTEGALIWLEFDQIIRRETGGKRSIDDFARLFFGMNDGDYGQLTYELDEIITKLNAVAPYDWAGLIEKRINTPGQPAPVMGIELGGYRLAWKRRAQPVREGADGRCQAADADLLDRAQPRQGRQGALHPVGQPGFQRRDRAGIEDRGGQRQWLRRRGPEDGDYRGQGWRSAGTADPARQPLSDRRARLQGRAALALAGTRRPTGLDRLLMPRRPMGKGK